MLEPLESSTTYHFCRRTLRLYDILWDRQVRGIKAFVPSTMLLTCKLVQPLHHGMSNIIMYGKLSVKWPLSNVLADLCYV